VLFYDTSTHGTQTRLAKKSKSKLVLFAGTLFNFRFEVKQVRLAFQINF